MALKIDKIGRLRDVASVKQALNSEYLSSLTQSGTFVTPRLDAEDLMRQTLQATKSKPNLKKAGDIFRSSWQAVKARPSDRLALGVAQAEDGSKTLALKLERDAGEAKRFAETLKEIVPTVRITRLDGINASGVEDVKETSTPLRSKYRPLCIGLSVGAAGAVAASIGPFVKFKRHDNAQNTIGFLASLGAFTKGDSPEMDAPVYQPGSPDIPRLEAQYQIGNLTDFVVLSRSMSNRTAAAIVEIEPSLHSDVLGNVVSTQIGPKTTERRIKGVSSDPFSWIGAHVIKIGRTTGETQGIVSAVEIDSLPVRIGRSIYLFDGIIEIAPKDGSTAFALPGDSGSLVFLDDSEKAIGMVLGSSGTSDGPRVYATRLDHSLSTLDATLL